VATIFGPKSFSDWDDSSSSCLSRMLRLGCARALEDLRALLWRVARSSDEAARRARMARVVCEVVFCFAASRFGLPLRRLGVASSELIKSLSSLRSDLK